MAQTKQADYSKNMKANSLVDLGDVVCTNIKGYGKNGEPCNLYKLTHKHYKKGGKNA